jgi:hypothetical protein
MVVVFFMVGNMVSVNLFVSTILDNFNAHSDRSRLHTIVVNWRKSWQYTDYKSTG